VKGLKDWAAADRPPVGIPFWGFRIMVAIGFLMLFVAAAGLWLRRGGRIYQTRWFLRLCSAMLPSGFIAVLCGWFVTEVGRQPWVVYGLMRTIDAASPAVAWGSVLTSLVLFIVVYGFVFSAGAYYIWRLIQRGPDAASTPPRGTPARPLSGAQEA